MDPSTLVEMMAYCEKSRSLRFGRDDRSCRSLHIGRDNRSVERREMLLQGVAACSSPEEDPECLGAGFARQTCGLREICVQLLGRCAADGVSKRFVSG